MFTSGIFLNGVSPPAKIAGFPFPPDFVRPAVLEDIFLKFWLKIFRLSFVPCCKILIAEKLGAPEYASAKSFLFISDVIELVPKRTLPEPPSNKFNKPAACVLSTILFDIASLDAPTMPLFTL